MASRVPHRLIRPDAGVPIILTAQQATREVVITSTEFDAIEVHRHYDVNLSTLTTCECEPRCPSYRVETFLAGVALVERTPQQEVWEEVLLQVSEQAMVSIRRNLMTKHDTTALRGAHFNWLRQSGSKNSAVVIVWRGFLHVVPNPFDVGWCLIKRRNISPDFFKAPQEISRASKPRMPLGAPQKKG